MKFVAFIEIGHFHYLDHLAPLCDLLNASILLPSKNDFEIAKKYYPNNSFIYKDLPEITPDYLVKNFDGFIHTYFWSKKKFDLKFLLSKKKYNKNFRSIYIPHGNSDKGHDYKIMEHYISEDIALIYGNNMIDFIKEKTNVNKLTNHIFIGNLRLNFYKKHQEFYKEIVKKEILKNLDPNKKTIFYSPTWVDHEDSSSFFHTYEKLIEILPKKFNLIIKLHPRLYDDFTGRIIHLMEKYKTNKNVKIILECPLIYPLLNYSDIYLGDFSSIGYDFLYFQKPMFFFNHQNLKKENKKRFLQQAGIEISLDQIDNIDQIILKNLQTDEKFKDIRKKLYLHTFQQNILEKDIKTQIIEKCQIH